MSYHIEYESFFFDPIIIVSLFESRKSDFFKSEKFMSMAIDLDQTFEHVKIKRLMDLGPTNLPRVLVHDDHISRPMTYMLATFTYVCLFPE